MNPGKGEGEDADPHGTVSSKSNGEKRAQRQRNSQWTGNRSNLPSSSYSTRANSLQHQPTSSPPPPPQDFQLRLPAPPVHHWRTGHPRPTKTPPPQQWQCFTRYRPFGESVRPYQFAPPPRFPQQFQFGTFPGRSSPRFRYRRENLAARGAENNVMCPNGNFHNNHPDVPHNGDVRPKSGPFLNGKEKSYKSKHYNNSSKSDKTRKHNRNRPHDTSQNCNHGDDSTSVANSSCVSDSSKRNSFFCEDVDRIKISMSCDERWLKKEACEGTFASAPDEIEVQEVGAVGGLPLSTNRTAAQERNVSPPVSEKDLIDEGAVFDLDNIFQNHEISGKNDGCFANGGIDSGDLDFVFDYESKESDETKLSELDLGRLLPSREDCGTNFPPVKLWSESEGNSHQRSLNSNGDRIPVCDIQSHDNNNNNNNGSRDLADSDGGEDTGDFIDTDLPSHAKHILSSSDEMDNQSSSKESDDDGEDEKRRRCSKDRQQSLPQRKEKSHSDFNSNDLSTLEPHLLNSLSHLSVQTMHDKESKTKGSSVFTQSNGATGNACCSHQGHVMPSPGGISDAENNFQFSGESKCASDRSFEGDSFSHVIASDVSVPTVYGAAADNNITHPPAAGNLLCYPNHHGTDYIHHSSSYSSSRPANNIIGHSNSHRQHHRQFVALSTGHSGSSASSGRHSAQLSEPVSQHCLVDCNASGTSVTEGMCNCGAGFSGNPRIGNGAGSACHHQPNGDDHVASGLVNNAEMNRELVDRICGQNRSVTDEMEDKKATISASAAERELNENPDLLTMMLNTESSSSSSSSMAGGGMEDPMMTFDTNGDHVDMVLLPMEEEIEPVLYGAGYGGGGGGGDTDFNVDMDKDDEYTGVPNAMTVGFQAPRYTMAGVASQYHSMGGSSRSFEECNGPHIRDPISIANRLPSKEFYELIKTVSSTDSYMRFFDKDGQDVQRSTQKTSNDEVAPHSGKGNSKQSKKSSGQRGDGLKVDRVMIWNEYEAYVVQYKQIAVSACGQTAVLNVLKALKFQCEKSVVCKVIKTNLRKEDKDIPEYLFSRTCAGTTAVELMSGVEKLTGGVIGGRFFHFWPPRKVKLLQWLAYWMKRGAIPMATLNLQQGPHSVWEVPDSWHHQMVYGVSHQGLYLTNPLEIVSERSTVKQLHSDSVLLVRRQDIVSRFRESTDLGLLLDHPDPRWMSMNVLGQVVNVLRECNMPSVPGYRLQVTSHVKIPASYQAGITLFMRKEQPAWNALVTASELPLE